MVIVKQCLSIEQICKISSGNWNIPSYDRPSVEVYSCNIFGAQLLNEDEPVTTKILGHTKLNSEVQGVYYASNGKIKFIPNSVFTGFVNLEYFFIEAGQGFKVIKPDSFRNCKNLKVILIRGNEIEKLEDNLFVAATKLEYINLQDNKILIIHRYAFNKLSKIRAIILSGNKITNLHPETFSYLSGLLTLDLLSNNCVDKKYERCNTQFREVEGEIRKLCSYSLSQKEVVELEKQRRDFRLEQQHKMRSLERLTESLKNTLKDHTKKIVNLTATIEQLSELQLMSDRECQQNSIKGEVELQIFKLLEKFEDKEFDQQQLTNKFKAIDDKINDLEQRLSTKISEESSKLSVNLDKNILLTDNKSSNNYLMLMKTIQDQKTSIDMSLSVILDKSKMESDETMKVFMKEITDIQDKMQKVGKGLERRLKKIERNKLDQNENK